MAGSASNFTIFRQPAPICAPRSGRYADTVTICGCGTRTNYRARHPVLAQRDFVAHSRRMRLLAKSIRICAVESKVGASFP